MANIEIKDGEYTKTIYSMIKEQRYIYYAVKYNNIFSREHICVFHLLSEGVPSREDASTSWPSSSGLRGHRRTYLTILESADNALFKMVRYVLLRPLRPELDGTIVIWHHCNFNFDFDFDFAYYLQKKVSLL
jgi:hypothetical protein